MPKAKVYNMNGGEVGVIELSDAVFGAAPSPASVHAVVRAHLAARRQGTQSALTRAEVSGGGIKPYRQKGTGRARQGSTRAPQWTHGGVAFAPKPRDYILGVNKKTRRLAMRSALSQKAADNKVLVIDGLDLPEIKTKAFIQFLSALGVTGKSYVVTKDVRENVVKSARNIQGVRTAIAGVMNVYDVVGAGTLIIDKAAVGVIEEVLAR
ncbi:MAG: 50S ribosomal protein L4 [Oscillospiraceae bacterium]|jgi:large subunit ribosomal protein L4|nr:50S ribosomal protein L4 [Oscillospiraceae bacterium]